MPLARNVKLKALPVSWYYMGVVAVPVVVGAFFAQAYLVFAIIFLGYLALLMLWLPKLRYHKHMIMHGTEAEAEITRVTRGPKSAQYVEVQYLVNGTPYTCELHVGDSMASAALIARERWKAGDRIRVLYDAQQPGNVIPYQALYYRLADESLLSADIASSEYKASKGFVIINALLAPAVFFSAILLAVIISAVRS